jgi:hypothetical protein
VGAVVGVMLCGITGWSTVFVGLHASSGSKWRTLILSFPTLP